MMLGFLLARAGVRTVVLEKHGDFLRDFRGDTIHPSTLASQGLNAFLEEVGHTAPGLKPHLGDVKRWDDVKLLTVAIDRLECWSVPKMTQAFQVKAQDSILAPVLTGTNQAMRPPLPLRLMTHSSWLRSLAARAVGLGFRPEHVQPLSPAVDTTQCGRAQQ